MVYNPADLWKPILWKFVSKEYLPDNVIVSLFEAPTLDNNLSQKSYRYSKRSIRSL